MNHIWDASTIHRHNTCYASTTTNLSYSDLIGIQVTNPRKCSSASNIDSILRNKKSSKSGILSTPCISIKFANPLDAFIFVRCMSSPKNFRIPYPFDKPLSVNTSAEKMQSAVCFSKTSPGAKSTSEQFDLVWCAFRHTKGGSAVGGSRGCGVVAAE